MRNYRIPQQILCGLLRGHKFELTDDNDSSSNLDEENENEVNNAFTQKYVRQSLGRTST